MAGTLAMFLLFYSIPAHSEDYYCEIMTLKGTAHVTNGSEVRPLKEGDLLKVGDVVQVDPGGQADLAFDKQWNNIARVWENTELKIKSIYPTGLGLDHGDVFAKLHKLPAGSTFEVQTPTAIAAVRGSEYWTSHHEGVTQVFNYSPSPVEVFGISETGDLVGKTIVHEAEKTEIAKINQEPRAPEKMSEVELKNAGSLSTGIEDSVKQVVREGRIGQAPDVAQVEKDFQTLRENKEAAALGPQEEQKKKENSDGQPGAEGDDKRPVTNGPGDGGSGNVSEGGPNVPGNPNNTGPKIEGGPTVMPEPGMRTAEPPMRTPEPRFDPTRFSEPRAVTMIEKQVDRVGQQVTTQELIQKADQPPPNPPGNKTGGDTSGDDFPASR